MTISSSLSFGCLIHLKSLYACDPVFWDTAWVLCSLVSKVELASLASCYVFGYWLERFLCYKMVAGQTYFWDGEAGKSGMFPRTEKSSFKVCMRGFLLSTLEAGSCFLHLPSLSVAGVLPYCHLCWLHWLDFDVQFVPRG